MSSLSTCRVCLASDREMYPLANTALEETYERVTSGTLVVEGWPCCVCGVCLSALRRCRRFIDTAREANDALNLWMQNQPNTLKLVELPLLSLTLNPVVLMEVGREENLQVDCWSWEVTLKSEIPDTTEDGKSICQSGEDTSGDEGDIPMEKVKHDIVTENGRILEMEAIDCDDKSGYLQMFEKVESVSPQEISNIESLDFCEVIINQQGTHLPSHNIKSDPALTKGTQIISTNSSGNTDPAAILLDKENLFSCPQCNYKTPKKQMLKQHDTDTDMTYTCDGCGYTTVSHDSSLEQDPKNRTGETVKDTFARDMSKHTDEKRYACNKCEFRCKKMSNLKQHLRTHTDERPFACDKCNYKSRTKSVLMKHLMSHTGEKPFACDKCDLKFSSSGNLKRHSMIHTGEKPFACNLCLYRCNQSNMLIQHLKTHADHSDKSRLACKSKNADLKKLACDICGYRCRYKGSLKKHLMMHTGEKPFACDKCPYRCNQRASLTGHLRTHTGEKPFACNQCNYKCATHAGLKSHLKTHTGEKPYACDKCDVKFSSASNLKRHLRTHTTEKLFDCHLCNAKLKTDDTLKSHLRIHTGERPYVCDICSSNYTEKRSLKNHILKVHGMQLVKPV